MWRFCYANDSENRFISEHDTEEQAQQARITFLANDGLKPDDVRDDAISTDRCWRSSTGETYSVYKV